MSEEEPLETAALAKSMLDKAEPPLRDLVIRLIDLCESLAAQQQDRLKEFLWFH